MTIFIIMILILLLMDDDDVDADDEEDDVLDELALRFLRVRGLFVDKGSLRLGRWRPMQYAPRQGLP